MTKPTFVWEVPFDRAAVRGGEPPAHFSFLTPDNPDREKALMALQEQAQEDPTRRHQLGLAFLLARLPCTAACVLYEEAGEGDHSLAAWVDFATAAAQAGRLGMAQAALALVLTHQQEVGVSPDDYAHTEVQRRFAEITQARRLQEEELRFLRLRIAACEEKTTLGEPTESDLLQHARALLLLGELRDELEPFEQAVQLIEDQLRRALASSALAETLVRAYQGCAPPEGADTALRLLREVAPFSPLLRAALRPTLDEQLLRPMEAESEANLFVLELMFFSDLVSRN